MSLNIKTTTNLEDPARFIADSIIRELGKGKKVLFFATGGSSIAVASKMAELLNGKLLQNLTIVLTDERYGALNHPDSNWYQLMKKGFDLPGAILIPTLIGEDIIATTKKFNIILGKQLEKAEYKIGLFGVGKDGHTAGNLPGSIAVLSQDLACHYETPAFARITITPRAIKMLDEAVVWMQGQEKWQVVKDLLGSDIDIIKQPAQILKKIPLLTIFTDYKSN